jgi:3-methyl-2-oxobutanoate hydroxymethyltransferase
MSAKITVPHFRAMRGKGQQIVCVTAYDAVFGALADEAGVDVVLVGDSVGNVLLGYPTTVPVTLADMVHHTRATRAGVTRALLLADLPFGTYEVSTSQAVESAVALMKAGAEGVKLEGYYPDVIAACVRAGIPVMGHLGMTPQSVNIFGGHRVQGKGSAGDSILETAQRLQDAGAFGFVLELVPADLAQRITDSLLVPTIGIGAGAGCSGQIQVLHDVLGLGTERYRHARAFVHGRECLLDGMRGYAEAVREGSFPTEENSF